MFDIENDFDAESARKAAKKRQRIRDLSRSHEFKSKSEILKTTQESIAIDESTYELE